MSFCCDFQVSKKCDSLLYWIWNGKILPWYSKEFENNPAKATEQSLKYLLDKNKSKINTIFETKYVKNQTLFNMINQNQNMKPPEKLQLLIHYGFNFKTLINMYDNVKHENGLIQLCRYSPSWDVVEMLFNHCQKSLNKPEININITHCHTIKWNALFHAAIHDSITLKYLLSKLDATNANLQSALNQKDILGSTIAHNVAYNPRPHTIDTFKLLQKYKFNFNVYNNLGRLPIHYACIRNCASLLSWMIDENIFDQNINCKTKYARNMQDDGFTPLYFSIKNNSVECVDVLCKQSSSVDITRKDINHALDNDSVKILKFLLCGLFTKFRISSWKDIQSLESSNVVSLNQIQEMISYCKSDDNSDSNNGKECLNFLNDLFSNGYACENFKHIAFALNYDLKTVIKNSKSLNSIDGMIADDGKISNDYEIEKDLGKGTFGLVQLGINKKTGEKVAIKHIVLNNKTPIQFITSEIESLKKLSIHSNIINLLDYSIFSNKVLLYFEYCLFGDLYSLLNQCDHFSLRISFKYFTQLLDAINTCHKKNIVHRDLKLQNILISDTFQLKVADFGLASIVDNKNEIIYNVGTPLYKSPELLEHFDTKYDISNIIVLKSCDVFSLSIIFWQMMNGIEYVPFKCFKNNGINSGNYKLIKLKQYDKFWNVHKKCHMLSYHSGNNIENTKNYNDLLCHLFEKMFEFSPYSRITIDEILKEDFIVSNNDNALFYMNNSQLESFVRDQYHQTKNNSNQHTKAPSTYYSDTTNNYNDSEAKTNQETNQETSQETSGLNISHFLEQDSSQAQINANESKIYWDDNKIIYSWKPIVVMIGIENKKKVKNVENKNLTTITSCQIHDYISVKQMLVDIKHYDMIYRNGKDNNIVHLKHSENNNYRNSSNIENEYKLSWKVNDLDAFNDEVFDILQNMNDDKYDCLIYIISCHCSKHYYKTGESTIAVSKHIVYDSYNNEYSCNEKIFDKFNNRQCSKLAKKAKVFVIDSNNQTIEHDRDDNDIDNETKIDDNYNDHDFSQDVNFIHQYKRVIYCGGSDYNCNAKDGGLLINSLCASLCNNQSKQNKDDENYDNVQNLNDIVNETETRLKQATENQMYDENYIPKRCKILLTPFKPLKSTVYYDKSHMDSNSQVGSIVSDDAKDKDNSHSDNQHNHNRQGHTSTDTQINPKQQMP